jgi:hypothetical protein
MKKIEVLTLTLVFIAMGMFVSVVGAAKGGNGGKPDKPDKPALNVEVTGLDDYGVTATGNPENIRLTFGISFDGFFVDDKGNEVHFSEKGDHVANPDDNSSALSLLGSSKNKYLSYFYCTAAVHLGDDLTNDMCNHTVEEEHNPEDYRRLIILHGNLNRKAGITVFPEGSAWIIRKKIIDPDGGFSGETVAEGTLVQDVTYKEVYSTD